MKQEIVLYCSDFKPKQEYLDFIKSLGYKDYKELKCRIDKRVIKYTENNYTKICKYSVYKGKKVNINLITYLGFAFIRPINLNRKFELIFTNVQFPFVNRTETIWYKD